MIIAVVFVETAVAVRIAGVHVHALVYVSVSVHLSEFASVSALCHVDAVRSIRQSNHISFPLCSCD